MQRAFLFGRLIVGGYYLFAASSHFLQLNALADYAKGKGIPAPRLAVLAGGVTLLAGGASIVTGVLPSVGIAALVLFFLPVTFTMHRFWQEQDAAARTAELESFARNLALLGSALMLLAVPQPWPFRVDF